MFRRVTKEEFSHPIMSYILPLLAFQDQKGLIAGTCVLVAPNLALTARHVLDEIYKYFGLKPSPDKSLSLDVYLSQVETERVWYVSQVFTWSGTDIAFLKLCPRNEQAKSWYPQHLQMTIDSPSVNSEITALGYPKSEIIVERNDLEATVLKIKVYPTISTGRVLEVHQSLRDKAMLNFPCFTVAARFAPGMSGGAVFNERKELCGLICSELDVDDDDQENYSNAVSIWPSMIIRLKFEPDGFLPEGLEPNKEYCALNLARMGHLNVQGHNRIEFFKHENGSDGVRRRF